MARLLPLLGLLLLTWALPVRADVTQSEAIAYVPSLLDANPLRYYVSRYDLAAGFWIEPIAVRQWVGSVAVDDEAVYVTLSEGLTFFPPGVARYSKSGELVWLREFPSYVGSASVDGELLFVGGSTLRVLDARTGEDLHVIDLPIGGLSLDRARRRLFGRSGATVVSLDYGPDGSIGEPRFAIPRSTLNAGGQTFVFDGERVFDGTAAVFDDELAWQGNLRGLNVYGMVQVGGGYAALHVGEIVRYDANLTPVGRFSVVPFGTYGAGLFVLGEDVFLLWSDPLGVYRIRRIRPDEFAPYEPAPVVEPTIGVLGALDAADFDGETLYLLSRDRHAVFRWSLAEQRFLETIPLLGDPRFMILQQEQQRIVLAYPWGLHAVDLTEDARERPWVDLPEEPCGLLAAGDRVVACVAVGSTVRLDAIAPDGSRVEGPVLPHSDVFGVHLGWDGASRRVYARVDFRPYPLYAVALDPSGSFGPLAASDPVDPTGPYPDRFPFPDGDLIDFAGLLLDAQSQEQVARLTGPDLPGASARVAETLVVLHPRTIASFDSDFSLAASVPMDGAGGFLFPMGEQVVAVRSALGRPGLNVRIFDPLDLDEDGVALGADAFPSDPLEWSDRDGDGAGDNGDAFPDDPLERTDRDGDGVGDRGDAFPDDPAEWADSDGDRVGDNADAFPFDRSESEDADRDGIPDHADPYPLGEGFLAVELEGTQRLGVSPAAPLGGVLPPATLALLEGGAFSLCFEDGCLLGSHQVEDAKGQRYRLAPQAGWLDAAREEMERAITSWLDRTQPRQTEVDLRLRLEDVEVRVLVNRAGTRAKLRVRIPYVAAAPDARPRLRTLRGAWVWNYRSADGPG